LSKGLTEVNNPIVPTLTMTLHDQIPTSVTVQADKNAVLLTYWCKEEVITTRDFSVKDNPELAEIVKHRPHDIEWNIEMVLDLLDMVDENEPACDVAPNWKWAGPWKPTAKPDFSNASQQADVA
jgi:hypothetical protein